SKAGIADTQGARLASYATMILSVGTIIGCVALPPLAERLGRKITLAIYFAIMAVFIALGFGYVFYLTSGALPWFMACLFLESAEQTSQCTRCGCRSNTRPNAARVPSHSQPRSGDSPARE